MWTWLVREWQWPTAALFTGVVLLAVLPPVAFFTGTAVALVFAQLPIYMLHQYEEHAGDRFRKYANTVLGGGQEALTPAATFWINSVGVWGVDVLALYLAWLVAPSAGLVAGYLTVVNAAVHLAQAVARREYHPGLVTAVVLFLPVGGWCVYEAGAGGGFWPHAAGLAGAVAIHAMIVAYVARRLAGLRKAEVAARIETSRGGIAIPA